ncbi:MAG TPA: hypothetical protein DDW52_30185, partial [Planctomycetaceae bacterium]|nr:hypothetical protein [Planctomycetaceae bacterium]
MRKLLARALRTTSSRHRPLQIAIAILLGVIAGGVANNPVLGFLVLGIAGILPIHLPVAFAAAACSAFIALAAAPIVGDLGAKSLTHPELASFWLRVDSYPLVPWLGLHNTVVQGGLIWGCSAGLLISAASLPMLRWILAGDLVEEDVLAANKVAGDTLAVEKASPLSLEAEPAVAHVAESPFAATAAATNRFATQPELVEVEDDDSFVALSADELRLLDKLDSDNRRQSSGRMEPTSMESTSKEPTSKDTAEQKQRFDLPATGASPSPHTERAVPAEHDFELPEDLQPGELQSGGLQSGPPEQSASPSLHAFDAVGRLEELLSGCRVQPHWIDRDADEESQTPESNVGADEQELARTFELSTEESADLSSEANGADAQTVLQRSAEIAGLVDHLLASLDDLESTATPQVEQTDWSEATSRRSDVAHEPTAASPHVEPSQADDNSAKAEKNDRPSGDFDSYDQTGSDGPVVLKLDDQSTLRFDQIDISETFSKPLYQPHGTQRQEVQRHEPQRHSVQLNSAPIDRIDRDEAAPRTSEGARSTAQTNSSTAREPSETTASKTAG